MRVFFASRFRVSDGKSLLDMRRRKPFQNMYAAIKLDCVYRRFCVSVLLFLVAPSEKGVCMHLFRIEFRAMQIGLMKIQFRPHNTRRGEIFGSSYKIPILWL